MISDFYLLRLKECHLFQDYNLTALKQMVIKYNLHTLSFEKDTIAALRGENYENLWILLEGKFSAEIGDSTGKRVKIETLNPPSPVASAVLFADTHELPVQLTAEQNSVVLSIPKTTLMQLFQEQDKILFRYLNDSGNKIQFLADKIRMLHFKNLHAKIAGFLLDLSDKRQSKNVTLPYTIEELSDVFGVARPSLSRALQNLVQDAIIEKDGKQITIQKEEQLKALLHS